ncbi:MAG: hypothetical protein ACO3RV_05350, partial [Luteolibacter sp.]
MIDGDRHDLKPKFGNQPQRGRFVRNGFSLVVTLSLMILLGVLALGMAGLSSIALRSAGLESDAVVARNNAQVALQMAIAEIQRLTGPDQRVTAEAAILEDTGGSPGSNPQWVGVWRTDQMKSDAKARPIVEPDSRRGFGYRDRRSVGARSDAADECIGWLVSGIDPDPMQELADDVSVILRRGSQPVRVASIPIDGTNPGRMAWFVSDESTKAKISLADPYAPDQPDPSRPDGVAMRRWLVPQSQDASAMLGDAVSPIEQEDETKLLSMGQLELSSLMAQMTPTERREWLVEHVDDVTVHGRSVLADPLNGGLKCDLTVYLEEGAAPAIGSRPGIGDDTQINPDLGDSRAETGPRFGLLRNWYRLRDQVAGIGSEATIEVQDPNTVSTSKIVMVDPGRQFNKPLIQPVLTEAVYYLNHVLDPSGATTRVVETIYPRIVLWNPFTTRLSTTGHVVFFDLSLNMSIRVDPLDKNVGTSAANQPRNMLGFYLPPTVFEPGEALVFTAPRRNQTFDANDLRNNRLSAESSPDDLGFFSRQMNG